MYGQFIRFPGVVLLLIACVGGFSQTPLNIDSLKTSLSKQVDDTNKVSTLYALTRAYKQLDAAQSRNYCDRMYRLSKKLNYQPGLIDALNEKCILFTMAGKYDSAQTICDSLIPLCEDLQDPHRLAKVYLNYGALLSPIRGPEEANMYYLKSLNLYKSVADSFGIANAFNGIGAMFWTQSEYDSAVYYYLELIKICNAKKFEQILIKGYINMGALYYERGEYNKARPYLVESIELGKKLNKYIFLSHTYQNLGNILYKENNLDSARVLYQKALAYSKQMNYQLGLAMAYIGLGNIAIDKEDYSVAASYFEKSINYSLSINEKSYLLTALINQGLIQERLGNFDRALDIYDTCLVMANEEESIYRKGEIYFNIYQVYRLKGDYENAFNNLLSYDSIQDSIFNLKKNKIISDLEIKYEKGKLLAANLELENDNLAKDVDLKKRTIQRNIYLFSGSGGILVLIFIIVFYRQRTNKKRIIAERKIEKLEEEKKMLAAKYLIEGQEEERKRVAEELHDGLGVLLSSAKIHFTTVRNKSPENKPVIDKAAKLLEQATRDVRRISHKMMPGILTKYGLVEAVEDMIDNINEMEGMMATIEVEGEYFRIKQNKEIMLYRVIQEMINNTLKHAHADKISIRIKSKADQMIVRFSDNGTGFDNTDEKHYKSMGLSSIQSRVNFLNGELALQTSPGNGVDYRVSIPLNQDDRIGEEVKMD